RRGGSAAAEQTILNTQPPQTLERPPDTLPPPGWKVEDLHVLEELFAPYIGPMARVLVKRAAKTTTDRRQFLALLAGHISDEQEKKAFLAEAFSKVPEAIAPGTTVQPGVADQASLY